MEALWRIPTRALLRGWMGLRAEGEEHVPAAGPLLLAATHESHADSLAVGASVRHRLTFLGDGRLASVPVLGPLLPPLGLHPVERGTGDEGLLEEVARLLVDRWASIVIYPEGSRSRDGRVHRPRSGVSRLAAATGVPVVPVGISGTAAAWPVDGRPQLTGPRRAGGVRVRFGPPLRPPADTPGDRRVWTEHLHDELVRLSGRPRDDAFAAVGGGGAPADRVAQVGGA